MAKDFRQLGAELRNWGRWGSDDERGTLNYITPERLVAAASLVRQGKVFDLGIPLNAKGPQPGGGRINPIRLMSETGADQVAPGAFRYADDYVFMPLQSGSQWDALAHVYYDDQLYNGFPASDVGPHGAAHGSIDKISRGVTGRGVLLDVARFRRVDWLDVGSAISARELERVAEAQGVEVRIGDILLVRTGWRRHFLRTKDRRAFMSGEPGLAMDCAQWLHERKVAAVGCDNWAVEVVPGEVEGEVLPLHMVLIRDMGMTLGEMLDLEELAADCAEDESWEFFFCGPPLKFTGAVGSPINPLAVK